MFTRLNISDRPDSGSILKNGFTGGVEDPCENIGVDDRASTTVVHLPTKHITTGADGPGKIRLTAGVSICARVQLDGAEGQLRGPRRLERSEDADHGQQKGKQSSGHHIRSALVSTAGNATPGRTAGQFGEIRRSDLFKVITEFTG